LDRSHQPTRAHRAATEDGGRLKLLTVLDEFTRESPAIELGRSIRARNVISVLEYLFMVRGVPKFIRSDNGPEFIADVLRRHKTTWVNFCHGKSH